MSFDINKFIPEKIRNEELYVKLSDLINKVIADYELELVDSLEKYKNNSTINIDVTKEIIREFGFGYIIDILNSTDEELRVIAAYTELIHLLKGHKSGLELVLNLLVLSFEIKEWWEHAVDPTSPPEWKVPDTFTLTFNANASQVRPETNDRLREFIKHYVYPVLVNLEIGFTFDDLLLIFVGGGFSTVQQFSTFTSPINMEGYGPILRTHTGAATATL